MVEREYPEELLRIREPVRTHLDITSLVFELERAGKSPVNACCRSQHHMSIEFLHHRVAHLAGKSATHPIEPPWGASNCGF